MHGGTASKEQAPVQPIDGVPPLHEEEEERPIRGVDAVDDRIGRGQICQMNSLVGLCGLDAVDVAMAFLPSSVPAVFG